MSKERIIWCNGKIDWIRAHRNDLIVSFTFIAMLCLTGPIESL